jgi:hypothetical protein
MMKQLSKINVILFHIEAIKSDKKRRKNGRVSCKFTKFSKNLVFLSLSPEEDFIARRPSEFSVLLMAKLVIFKLSLHEHRFFMQNVTLDRRKFIRNASAVLAMTAIRANGIDFLNSPLPDGWL